MPFFNYQMPKKVPHFAVVVAMLTVIVLLLSFWFTLKVVSFQKSNIEQRMAREAEHISYNFEESIDQAASLMNLMLIQISLDPTNKYYIQHILSDFRTNPNIANILSWTVFSWSDQYHQMTVDSLSGIQDTPFDLSTHHYMQQTTALPREMQVGQPVFGASTGRWMVPGAIGVTDKDNKYLGAMTIGFDINLIVQKLKKTLRYEGIDFALIDADQNVILKSSYFLDNLGEGESGIPEGVLLDSLKKMSDDNFKDRSLSHLDFYNKQAFYLFELSHYPYVLYVTYDSKLISMGLWEALTSRFIEIGVIGLCALLLLFYIYRRENLLRRQAEYAKEEALEASKIKSEFLNYTSHELRSPLNVIVLASEMMKQQIFGPMAEKYRQYAADINSNGQDLLEFIDDLLDEAQLKTGSIRVVKEKEVNVNEIIRRAVNLNEKKAQKNKVNIKVDVDENAPMVEADPRRLRQVLTNLISNGISRSPSDSTITVSSDSYNDVVDLMVSDQGQEVATKVQEKSTLQYIRGDKKGYAGLELARLKQLVEAQGGEFTITSNGDAGNEVAMRFMKEQMEIKEAA